MSHPMKYAVMESERRYLVRSLPSGVIATAELTDRYVVGTRLRLREVRDSEGVTRKLGHKVRVSDDPSRLAHTSMYLDEAEWRVLSRLPAHVLQKRRHFVARDGVTLVVDELADGTLLAEIDDGERPRGGVPDWLEVIRDVTYDENWTGAGLATKGG